MAGNCVWDLDSFLLLGILCAAISINIFSLFPFLPYEHLPRIQPCKWTEAAENLQKIAVCSSAPDTLIQIRDGNKIEYANFTQ
jgi:hypothetical protein